MGRERVVEVIESSLARASRGLEVAIQQGNSQLAALNLRQLFYKRVHLALIDWRLRRPSAHSHFKEALAVANRADSILACNSPGALGSYPLPLACGIACLLNAAEFNASHALALANMLGAGSESPEAALALVLTGQEPIPLLARVLESHSFPAEQQLWQESLQSYAALLAEASGASLEAAEKLYLLRKGDRYFANGLGIYGGGPDNEHVVDFWLGVVLHRLSYHGPSPHAWVGA